MTYDWEQQARDGILPHVHDLDEELAGGPFRIWGVAVVNDETGEAAYWQLEDACGCVNCADIAKDTMGDAMRAYDAARRKAFPEAGT